MIPYVPRGKRELPNCMDVRDLEADGEWLEDLEKQLDRTKEQAGTEELRPAPLPEKD